MQLKEKEETQGSKGVSPLALQKQTCQKLRKIQVKEIAIQGKNKELYEEKAETGVEGGVLLALKTETLLQKRKK